MIVLHEVVRIGESVGLEVVTQGVLCRAFMAAFFASDHIDKYTWYLVTCIQMALKTEEATFRRPLC
jgi:hypothetical protein